MQYIQPTCRTSFGALDVCFLLSTAGNRGYLYLNASFASDWTDCMCRGFQVVAVQYLYNRYDARVKKGALVQEEKSNHATLEDSPHITIVRCGCNSPPPTKKAQTIRSHLGAISWAGVNYPEDLVFHKENNSGVIQTTFHLKKKNIQKYLKKSHPVEKNLSFSSSKSSPSQKTSGKKKNTHHHILL